MPVTPDTSIQKSLSLSKSMSMTAVSAVSSVPLSAQAALAAEEKLPNVQKQQKQQKRQMQGVCRAAQTHKFGGVFAQPVTEVIASGYSEVVYRARSLADIRKDVESGAISSAEEFRHAFQLMFVNAFMYNNEDHDVHRQAREMHDDMMKHIEVRFRFRFLTQLHSHMDLLIHSLHA